MRANPLAAAFDRRLTRDPSRTLVASPTARATTGQIDALARAAERSLAELPPGTIVGLLAPDGPAYLASLIALSRQGAATLLLDYRTPAEECHRIVREIGARAFLICDEGWPSGPTNWRLERTKPTAEAAGAAAEALPAGTLIKITSGSTGAARGIVTPPEALLADDEALVATMGIRPDDRLMATIPMSHSYGLASLVAPALVRGIPLIVPNRRGPFGPLAAAADMGATVFPTVPAYLSAIGRLAEPPPTPKALRLVISAGALLPAATAARFRDRFGLPVHAFYGSSESGGIAYDREGGGAERGTVGTPVDGVEIELEAFDPGRPQDGGRVIVRSAAVASGYLPSGCSEERLASGRFRTEDLGIWDERGELQLIGRLDDIINVRGKKVNPREVQTVLLALDRVDEAAVLALEQPGEGCSGVRAVIACQPGSLSREEVLAWCDGRLANHKKPRSVVIVEQLPRTARGKVDRIALGRLASA
ncbi:MAG: AMP-binding protein [Acidobacteriota bacterium]